MGDGFSKYWQQNVPFPSETSRLIGETIRFIIPTGLLVTNPSSNPTWQGKSFMSVFWGSSHEKPSISIGSIPIHQGESPCFLLSILDRSQTPSQTQIHLSVEAKHIKIHPKCRDCWFNAINHTNYKFTQKNRQFDASRNPKNMNLLDLDLAGSFPPTAPGQHGACPEPVERWAEEMLL